MFYLNRTRFCKMVVLLFSIISLTTTAAAPTIAQHRDTAIYQQTPPVDVGAPPGTARVDNLYNMGTPPPGTVRINNLANLEALLNIIANLAELAGIFCGFMLFCHALFFGKSNFVVPLVKLKLNRTVQFILAFSLIVIGLAVPGLINWLVASSSRDVEIFS